jgi:beta-glucosidase
VISYFYCTNSEPNVYSLLGHAIGKHAPGRSSDRNISPEGDSRTEPLIVGHNLLLAHASAVKAYHDDFASSQGGKIGLVVNMLWGGQFRFDGLQVIWGANKQAELMFWNDRIIIEPLTDSAESEIGGFGVVNARLIPVPLVTLDKAATEKFLAVYNGWQVSTPIFV